MRRKMADQCKRRVGMMVLVAAVLVTMPAAVGQAQVVPLAVRVQTPLSEEASAELLKRNIGPLRDRLRLEMEFLAEVCELNHEETASLQESGRRLIDQTSERLALAIRQLQQRNRVQNGAVIAGQRRAQNGVVVVGRGAALPDDLNGNASAAPDGALRRELTKTLQDTWRDKWNKFEAERHRLDAFRQRAGALAKVAELDEALLLSGEQRTALHDELLRRTSDGWWKTANAGVPVDATQRLYSSVACGGLGAFMLRDVDWEKLLKSPQLAAYNELQAPRMEEIVIVQKALRLGVVVDAAPAPAAAGNRDVAARAAEAERLRQAVALRQALKQGQVRFQRRVVRQGPRLEDQLRQLTNYLQRRIDDVDAACDLTAPQREKLLLAGKLDLEKQRAEAPPPEKLAEDEKLFVQKVQVAAAGVRPPPAVFSDEASYFRKALRGRLLDEQKQKLAAAERARRSFQRQALVEAVVAGFERATALTSRQCRELSLALNAALAPDDGPAASNWRAEALRTIAQLPEERLRPLLFDHQLRAALQQQAQLALIAEQFEAPQPGHAVIFGGGVF